MLNLVLQNKTKLWKMITWLSVVLFFLSIFFAAWFFTRPNKLIVIKNTGEESKQNNISNKNNNEQKCPDCKRRLIDGVYTQGDKIKSPLFAIMIDNHPDARPPFGIDKANLVYEAEVEGNFTRYMAIFDLNTYNNISEIGPVRSARPYFLSWAAELGAIYTHCGGSPEALVEIIQKNIIDLNEYYNGQYFWRTSKSKAPHNILTSTDNLQKSLKNFSSQNNEFAPWKFKDDSPITNKTYREIKINYTHQDFKITWKYDETNNDYTRFLSKNPQLTSENNLIVAKNIIIQIIPAKVIDEKLRLKMVVIGGGKAVICLDGACQEGYWKKDDFSSRTKFYYQDDSEIQLNAGQTWVEVVRPEIKIEY